ncbi:unnamed protein product [Arabidopsis arenosa]|uniref:V-type proton ATPase proteolipid subunit n=1 Tax=Arabidopsis arenosa TaxID=38785 RepID=A0A8S1ZEH1_ARAAE|nr:unnamed protein product [Arabidopsis arenosa]
MASSFSGDETAPFFGFLGAAAALVFSCMGAAYGTAKSGVGVASMGVMRPELVMKSIVPVVMAGVLVLLSIRWLCSSLFRSCLWSRWSLRRYGYWNCRRCRS